MAANAVEAKASPLSSLASNLFSEDRRRTVRIFLDNRLSVLGLGLILFWVVVALVGPFVAPYTYDEQDIVRRLEEPSSDYLLGTDWLGRDILSRILSGARITLFWGLMPIALAIVVGVPTGAIGGYFEGWFGSLIMRLADLFLSVPALLLAIAITTALSPSIFNAMLAISVVWWPWYTRLIHAQTLSLKEQVFVEAAQGLGASGRHILIRHVLPNTLSTILVRASMDLGFSVLYMAGLGFIGLGAQPPSPEWGLMVSSGRSYMPEHWWISLFAGLAIFSVVFGFNAMGDGVRDALDPEIRGR
jgi:peptide/nickel transport system permease protein